MKIDGSLMVNNPSDAGPMALELEAIGFDGAYTFEGQHDPFLPLLVAAENTKNLKLTTGVAIAFARNPMLLANLGYDLQLASKGRFILGLGSQIKPHIERRFSATWSKPAARMRDMVNAIKAIWHSWETAERLNYQGEFYQHTLMTHAFNPGPNPHGLPPIYLAGIGPKMTEVVGEVADGLLIHPFQTSNSLSELTLPSLALGAEKANRKKDDIAISCQLIMATGFNEEEFEINKLRARNQIAFYGSTPAYKPVLDCQGWGDLQPKLNALSKEGKWDKMGKLINDEILQTIAIVGTPAEVAIQIKQRCGNFERVCPVAYGGSMELYTTVLTELKK
jgi:probable F420-dependent oxidoreductase